MWIFLIALVLFGIFLVFAALYVVYLIISFILNIFFGIGDW